MMHDDISFTSAQNVQLSYETASLGDRILAYFVDSFVKFAYIICLLLIFTPLMEQSGDFPGEWPIMLLISPIAFYSLFFEYFFQGQSPGKKAVNIRVISLGGESANLSQYLIRWLFRIVDFQIMSGIVALVAIAAGNKGQRIGDMVAGTSVISLKRTARLNHTVYQRVEKAYEPVYLEAGRLSKRDIEIIKEILGDKTEKRFELITKLAAKIAGYIEVEKQGSSESFLKTLVKDYNYIKGQ